MRPLDFGTWRLCLVKSETSGRARCSNFDLFHAATCGEERTERTNSLATENGRGQTNAHAIENEKINSSRMHRITHKFEIAKAVILQRLESLQRDLRNTYPSFLYCEERFGLLPRQKEWKREIGFMCKIKIMPLTTGKQVFHRDMPAVYTFT